MRKAPKKTHLFTALFKLPLHWGELRFRADEFGAIITACRGTTTAEFLLRAHSQGQELRPIYKADYATAYRHESFLEDGTTCSFAGMRLRVNSAVQAQLEATPIPEARLWYDQIAGALNRTKIRGGWRFLEAAIYADRRVILIAPLRGGPRISSGQQLELQLAWMLDDARADIVIAGSADEAADNNSNLQLHLDSWSMSSAESPTLCY